MSIKFTLSPLHSLLAGLLFCTCTGNAASALAQATDWRNIENGLVIPDKRYSDQPYIVKTDDGAWLCVSRIHWLQ